MTSEPTEDNQRSGAYVSGASKDPRVMASARVFRRVGYTVAAIITVWMTVPVGYAATFGSFNDLALDPYSKAPVKAFETRKLVPRCDTWARTFAADPKREDI